MPESNQHSELRAALALADEIESAEKEHIESGWGGYPWEHLGDASRDVSKLIRGLRDAKNLVEQLQAVQKHRDQLADMAREQEDENRRLLEQLEDTEKRLAALVDAIEWEKHGLPAASSDRLTEAVDGLIPSRWYLDLKKRVEALERENARWLSWSDGRYPDTSPGDVIHAYSDGTIILDDSVTAWNPLRALVWIERRREDNAARASNPAKERP